MDGACHDRPSRAGQYRKRPNEVHHRRRGTYFVPSYLPQRRICPVLYHHAVENYRATQLPLEIERAIPPNVEEGLEDNTSYLDMNDDRLCPGVRLSSGPLTDIAEASLGTTSGVLLRKNTMERLTVSNRGFPTNEVYHPNIGGRLIEEIVDRKPTSDVALAKILAPIAYTNSKYFDSAPPRRLLTRRELGKDWCTLDGMTTSLVLLLRQFDRVYRHTGGIRSMIISAHAASCGRPNIFSKALGQQRGTKWLKEFVERP